MEYNKVIRFCVPNQQDPCKPIGSDGYAMRDRDHKFEWSRSQFQDWCQQHAQRYSYSVSFAGVGECSDHAQWLAQAPEGGMDVGMATQVPLCHCYFVGSWRTSTVFAFQNSMSLALGQLPHSRMQLE